MSKTKESKTKHTPGPWKVRKTDNAIRRLTGAKTPEEVEANARLIAASPDMYKLLEDLRITLVSLKEIHKAPTSLAISEIDKALAKARGES